MVRNKVLTGTDLNGAAADGFINVNLAAPFVVDPNAPINSGQIDFYSVLDHELTHALGFLSLGTTTNDQALSKFDQFLTTGAGVPIYDPVTGSRNVNAFNDAFANNAQFDGTNAVALYGSPVPIEGADGDLSHLGTDAFTVPTAPNNALMLCCGNPNSPDQSEPRNYNSAEIGILTDLGYTPVAAAPEPTTSAFYAWWISAVVWFGEQAG